MRFWISSILTTAVLLAIAIFADVPAAEAQRDDAEKLSAQALPRDAVVVFAQRGFQGRFEVFRGNDKRLDDNRIGNDGPVSVRVPRGCVVRLFEHFDYIGRSIELREDVADLDRTRFGSREASSIQVECKPTTAPDPGDPGRELRDRRGAILFAESAFRGRYQFFPSGAEADLGRKKIGDDAVSSVRLARGCRLVLFAEEDFRGKSMDIDRDAATLRRTAIGPDTASSMIVDCERPGAGVTLFTDSRFRGQKETLRDDVPHLGHGPFGEDRLGSIRISRGCRATIYEEPNYRGRSLEIDRDIITLVGQSVGPDAASSIRVACKGGGPGQDGDLPYGSGAVLYDRSYFRGENMRIRQDEARLSRTSIGNDRVSSIRLAPGCEMRLFRDADYRGRGVLVEKSIDDLDKIPSIGSNELSSVRIRCNSWSQRRSDSR